MASSCNRFMFVLFLITTVAPCCLSISCFECNSGNNSRCLDPFDNRSMVQVNCDDRNRPPGINTTENLNITATMCKKVQLQINNKIIVHRSCGYVTDDVYANRCVLQRQQNVHLTTCTCKQDMCNAAPVRPLQIIMIAFPVVISYVLSTITLFA